MTDPERIAELEAENARLRQALTVSINDLERGVRWADETPKDDWMGAFDNLYSGVSDALDKARAALNAGAGKEG